MMVQCYYCYQRLKTAIVDQKQMVKKKAQRLGKTTDEVELSPEELRAAGHRQLPRHLDVQHPAPPDGRRILRGGAERGVVAPLLNTERRAAQRFVALELEDRYQTGPLPRGGSR